MSSAYIEAQRKPLNLLCQGAVSRLGPDIAMVPLNKDGARVISTDGVRAATNNKVTLNTWHDRNPHGGFGVVPEYSNLVGLWVPIETAAQAHFSLSATVANSVFVNLLRLCEQGDWELHGQLYFITGVSDPLPAGVIAGGVTEGIPNSGCTVLNPRVPMPIGGWSYWKDAARPFEKPYCIKVEWGDATN